MQDCKLNKEASDLNANLTKTSWIEEGGSLGRKPGRETPLIVACLVLGGSIVNLAVESNPTVTTERISWKLDRQQADALLLHPSRSPRSVASTASSHKVMHPHSQPLLKTRHLVMGHKHVSP
jgi:hypothetical protein